MAKLTTTLNIVSDNINKSFPMEDSFESVVTLKEKLDNSDAFIKIVSLGSSISGIKAGVGARLAEAQLIVIKNCGSTAIELSLEGQEYGAGDDLRDNAMYSSIIIAPKDYIVLPNQRVVNYSTLTSAGNASSLDNAATSTLKTDSGANLDDASGNSIINHTTRTNLQIEEYTSAANCGANLFRVGDTIRVDNEIMKVTAIGSGADLANNVITVTRGEFGSTASTDGADGDPVEFAFFNEYHDYDKYSKCQTDRSGKYKTSNLILNAGQRSLLQYKRGFVRGSFAMKFYEKGYQELGLSGISNLTSSGLATSTAYAFNITANGGSVLANLAFTTDSSNVNWLGTNGVISKINDSLATQYRTSGGNLYDKQVIVSVVDGDIRFTSIDQTSASAILLAAPSSGTTPFGVGSIPAIGDVEAPIAAKLPDDTIRTSGGYVEKPNETAFAYDDGQGNIIGAATGTINYETGAIDITSGPNLAEFVVSAEYNSVHSGGINETSNFENGLLGIYARSCNSKINGEVEVIGFM